MKAIRFEQTGGPEVLRLVDADAPAPQAGEVRVKIAAAGVNFVDTYQRSGLYPVPLPSGLGSEMAGVVDAVGEGVTRFKIGDRVGSCTSPLGAYADYHCAPQDRIVHLPAGVSDDVAAASMLKGMTARYLLRKTFRVEPGHVIVAHAAAGGVGQILVQWGKHLGATVIAVVGADEKGKIAAELGADHVIVSTRENISQAVREFTKGEGADVVYDSVGKDTFDSSLDSLKPLGMMVSFGNASGPAPAFNPQILAQKGSLFFTRPSLFHYARTAQLLQESADDLFSVILSGAVKIAAPAHYALADAVQAHRDLEGRKTTGSLVLKP